MGKMEEMVEALSPEKHVWKSAYDELHKKLKAEKVEELNIRKEKVERKNKRRRSILESVRAD